MFRWRSLKNLRVIRSRCVLRVGGKRTLNKHPLGGWVLRMGELSFLTKLLWSYEHYAEKFGTRHFALSRRMMHDFAKNGKKKRHIVQKRCGKLVDLEGFEPLTSRMRTERSPSSLAFVHTLYTVRKGKSTCIRSYKRCSHAGGLSWSQVWSPRRWFSRWSCLGRNMVGGQVSYRPLRYS